MVGNAYILGEIFGNVNDFLIHYISAYNVVNKRLLFSPSKCLSQHDGWHKDVWTQTSGCLEVVSLLF